MNLNPFARHPEIEAMRIDEGLSTSLYDRARDGLPILGIRPYRGDDGLERGERLLKSLHEDEWMGKLRTKNTSDAHAFELHYTDSDEILQFRFAPGSADAKRQMLRQLKTYYPDSDIMELSPQFMDAPQGKYIAGARLELMESDYYYPIKHYKVESDQFEQDPYDSITSEMVGSAEMANADVLVQIVIRPAISHHPRDGQNWYSGLPDTLNEMGEEKTSFRKEAILEEMANVFSGAQGGQTRDVEFSQTVDLDDNDVYQVVKSQYGEKAYHVNFRIIAISDDPDIAESRVLNTAGMYRKFYNSKNRQGFRVVPYDTAELREFLESAAARKWVDRDIVFPVDTATGVCHVPTDLNTQQADYSMTTAGKGVPPRTPRFDFEAVGLDRATSSPEEKQRAMLSDEDPENPVWYGWGTKNGIEAGVDPEILNVHQFVGGSTGMGKTTLLTNYFRQIMQRGHGGLFFDPKGEDAKDIVSLIPEGRKDDLIYIDIGADSEYEIGFNFLEVPLRNPEIGTASTEAAVEALADDLEALLAQSGSGGGWHARMSGITRSVVRGLAQWQIETDRDVTMLDMYYALLDEDGRQEYADMMASERIEWIEDYAQRVLADIPQQDVEPLIRRLKEWVESGTTRRVVSHPSSTISIEDVVRDGKIIVVRNRSSSDTAKRLIATALIRRIWIAIREQTHSDDEPDPPQFFTVIDEFDKIVSKESEIHNILREARAFGLSLTLACQNLETGDDDKIGLPDGVQRAIQGNCKTFLTFDPGDPADAREIAPQHSPDIEPDHLTELSKYHIYMRTHDDHDEKTDSYKAKTLGPALEALGEAVRSPSETDDLIQTSQETHGQLARTSKQIKEDTLLYPGSTADSSDGKGDDEETSDEVRAKTCKAVYDQSIREHGEGTEWVRLDVAAPRIRRYLPDSLSLPTTEALWGNTVEKIPKSHLERESEDDVMRLRCTEEGILPTFAQGSNQNAAGPLHRETVEKAYAPFTEFGFTYEIPTQDGESMPDALITLEDVDLLQFDADATTKEIHDAYEEFTTKDEYALMNRLSGGETVHIQVEESTGDTAPAQTIVNCALALNEGCRCLFVCRTEGIAQKVWDHLNEEPRCMRSTAREGCERYYNTNDDALQIGGNTMYRPDTARDTAWFFDNRTGEIILSDSDGEDHARFDSPEEVFSDPTKYPDVEGEKKAIKPPAIPELMFDDELDPSRWDTLVADDGGLSVYDGSDLIPLDELVEHEKSEEQNPLADF